MKTQTNAGQLGLLIVIALWFLKKMTYKQAYFFKSKKYILIINVTKKENQNYTYIKICSYIL